MAIGPLGSLAGDSEAQLLRGTEDAISPSGLPTTDSLGFFAQGKLKTIEVGGGGPPRTLSDAPLDSRGGAWGRDGTILFAPTAYSGAFRIAATGGTASQSDETRRVACGELA